MALHPSCLLPPITSPHRLHPASCRCNGTAPTSGHPTVLGLLPVGWGTVWGWVGKEVVFTRELPSPCVCETQSRGVGGQFASTGEPPLPPAVGAAAYGGMLPVPVLLGAGLRLHFISRSDRADLQLIRTCVSVVSPCLTSVPWGRSSEQTIFLQA